VAVPPVDANGDRGPELFQLQPSRIAYVGQSFSFLPPGLAQLFEHVGVVFRPHSMVKKLRTLYVKYWSSKPSEAWLFLPRLFEMTPKMISRPARYLL
jgi:hypothetical protein